MASREAVDPRTEPSVLDTLRSFAASRIGARDWSARLDAARAELVERVLASGSTRSLAGGGAVRLMDVGGDTQELRALADGKVTVVAFWSRFCLPAVQELPKLNAAAARLTSVGVRVIGIVEEASLSPVLHAFLYQKHVTMPTYLDAWHEASRAFNQWGTPYYYVLDPAGRVRFDVVTSADELLVRAEALRLSVVSDRASR
jgi:peroxiredoxin